MERDHRIRRPWGDRTPYGRGEPWPTRVDAYLAEGVRPTRQPLFKPAAAAVTPVTDR
ncbi:hypothetical protein ACFY4I_26030 [Streptomyces scabiei]|uniref:hypothetical protein n=1 Tax=Streptomyces scabiei TaxID=1930 RepID=UPI0036813464